NNSGWREANRDAELPREGAKGDFRVCDWVAYKMSDEYGGAPRCELWWSEKRRDAAVEKCKTFLEKYGERLGHEFRQMTFPVRTNAATPAEVERGSAIFALSGKTRSLPWKLPVEARWVALQENPWIVREMKDGKIVTKT